MDYFVDHTLMLDMSLDLKDAGLSHVTDFAIRHPSILKHFI